MTAMTTEQVTRTGGVTAVLERPGARLVYEVAGDGIPGAAYRVIAGAGHMTSMEQPAAVSDLLARFVLDGASWAR